MSLVGYSDHIYKIKVPVGTVTAPYGSIDPWHSKPHSGIDLSAPIGTKLYAPLSGHVSEIKDYGDLSLGKAIFIRLDDGRQYVMGHLSEFANLHVGDKISKGDFLGLSGSSGRSSGGHVHFGCFDKRGNFVDPDTFFESVKSSLSLLTDKLLVTSQESQTAFVNDPTIVSLDENSDVLFKLLDVISDVL